MAYKAIRGTKDILPAECSEWQEIENACREVFRTFGYGEIRTPIMEETGLFIKTVGEDTDIVKKEMFSFTDRGERDISLRPEGTAPVIRAYLEHNLDKTEPFQKICYIGPMFRAERPQAGRLRQFHQVGVEAIGSSNAALDAEVIDILTRLLRACKIEKYQLHLNNLGCREDKKKLSALLVELFSKKISAAVLCEDCRRRLKTNPIRVLDCKNDGCRTIIRKSFGEIEFLCRDCKAHFDRTLKFLDLLNIKYTVDPYIVRGIDYYTRTVFEVTHEGLGSQNAIGAGGRYDNLIKDMGGPSLSACGFALGLDRVLMARSKEPATAGRTAGIDIFVATLGEAAYEKGFLILNELRHGGISSDIDYENSSLKSQMRRADKLGASLVLIVGDEEIARNEAVLRDMRTKKQVSAKFDSVISEAKTMLGAR